MSQPIDLSYFSLYLSLDDPRKPGQKLDADDFDRVRGVFESRMRADPETFFGVGNNTHSDGGVGLIGREADYVVRNADGRPALWYRRRAPLGGDNRQRLKRALRDLLTMADSLAREPRLKGAVSFGTDRFRVFVDRSSEVSNTDVAFDVLAKDLEPVARALYGGEVRLSRIPTGGRLGAEIAGPTAPGLDRMMENVEKI